MKYMVDIDLNTQVNKMYFYSDINSSKYYNPILSLDKLEVYINGVKLNYLTDVIIDRVDGNTVINIIAEPTIYALKKD